MPKMDFLSNAAPSAFVCPPKTEPPGETAVLSSTATTKATKKKEPEKNTQQEEATTAVSAMAVDAAAEPEATIVFLTSSRFQPVRAVSHCSCL
jgi:hypothetical protein